MGNSGRFFHPIWFFLLFFLPLFHIWGQPFTFTPAGTRCAAVGGATIRVSTENNVLARTCTTTQFSPTLENFGTAGTTGIVVGMRVVGPNIPTNTPFCTVLAVTATTVTLSRNATLSASSALSFFRPIVPVWSVDPGLTVVTTGTGPGANQYWADVQSVGQLAAGAFCPGNVYFGWQTIAAGCTSLVSVNTRIATPVYKAFTAANLNARSNADGQGDFQIFTETPPCVGSNQLVNLSVRPYHMCGFNPAQQQGLLGIAPDNIDWTIDGWTQVYRSVDGASLTARTPASIGSGTYNHTVSLGQCNRPPLAPSRVVHAVRTFNVTPSNGYITLSGTGFTQVTPGSLNANGESVAGSACLPSISTPTFTLTMEPAQTTGSEGYQWTIPEGFTCAGNCNTQTISVTALGNAAAGSGTLSCMVNNGQCGRSIAFFNINRNLSGNVTIATTRTRPNPPLPPAGDVNTWPDNCYFPDLNYAFLLNNAPIGNTYTWGSVAAPNPFWTNISGQGTVNFSATPGVPGTTRPQAPPAFNISVVGAGPNFLNGQANCPTTVSNPGFMATDHVSNALSIRRSGITFDIIQTNNNQTNWMNTANFACNGQTLGSGNFYYEWGYVGTFTPNNSTQALTNTAGSIIPANNAAAFTQTSASAINGIEQNPGTFGPNTTVYCRIRKRNTGAQCTGTDAARNCFYVLLTLPL
jgi:hypothetical protein